jgi:YHS domain-containing protein
MKIGRQSTTESGRHMRNQLLKHFLAVLIVTTPAMAGVPGSHSQVNLDGNGVALGGYDPVAYFDGGKPTHGVAAIFASYDGARYLFATAAHRRAFLTNPKKYVPEFGGFCAVGTSFGEKVDIDPETGEVVNGKLYLNYNQHALDLFNKDQSSTITKAESNWSTVKDKSL